MGLGIQSRWLSAVGILGLVCMSFGSCGGAGTAAQDVGADAKGYDIPDAEDSLESDVRSPAGVFGCPEESTHPTGTQCGCLVDFNSSVLLFVSNAPTGWNEWPEGLSPYDGFSKARWTVTLNEGDEVLLLEAPLRLAWADSLVYRTARLAGTGIARFRLELLGPDGQVAAAGNWERTVRAGEKWTVSWAWDYGNAAQGMGGSGYWQMFEPQVPYCPPETGECFNLWLGATWYDPLTDGCTVLDKLHVQPAYGQSIEATASKVEQLLGCCDSIKIAWEPGGERMTLSIPDPAMYMGAIFRLGCAVDSGLTHITGTITSCL